MYKIISLFILVLVIEGETKLVFINEPVLLRSSILKSEIKSEIEWEKHIMDFIELIDIQKVIGVGINYMNDEEVLGFVNFLTSKQFKDIVFEIESMTEFRQMSSYLASKGYAVDYLIDYINDALDLPPYQQSKTNIGIGKSMSALLEDIIEILPLEDMKKLFESKLINYPEIADLFQIISSEEFLDMIKHLGQNPEFKNYKEIFESYGFDFNQFCTLAVKIFGTYYQGVFCG